MATKEKESLLEAVQAAPNININTANGAGNKITDAQMEHELKQVQAQLGKMKKKNIMIPKQMADKVGTVIPAWINGVRINVPVNGKDQEIPEAYHEIIVNSLQTIDSGDVREDRNLGAKVGDEALL
jgi:hypothetical protein